MMDPDDRDRIEGQRFVRGLLIGVGIALLMWGLIALGWWLL